MILDDFNALHPKLQFTAEAERDNTVNYLDISIHRTPTNIKTAIYRKPTFTGTIIPYLQPLRTPQIHSSQDPIQQTRLLQPTTRRIPTRAKYHPARTRQPTALITESVKNSLLVQQTACETAAYAHFIICPLLYIHR